MSLNKKKTPTWLHLSANLICQKHSQEIYQPDVTMVTVIGGLCALCLRNESAAGLRSFEYWRDMLSVFGTNQPQVCNHLNTGVISTNLL